MEDKLIKLTHRGTLSSIKYAAEAILGMAAFALFAGLIANGFRGANAQDVVITAAVGNGSLQLSTSNAAPCSTYDAATDALTIDNVAGSISSGCLTLSATTDGADGYTLTIEGDANLTTGTEVITPKNGTLSNPSNFAVQAANGQWGFAIPQGQIKGMTTAQVNFDSSYPILASNNTTNTAKYSAVPTTPTAFSQTLAANAVSSPDVYNVHFAIATGNAALSGDYAGTVTISGSVNAAPQPPTITAPTTAQIFAAGTTSTTLTATTLANSNCYFGTTTNPTTLMSTTGTTAHSQGLTGLSNGNAYTYYIRCQSTSGQGSYSGDAGVTFYVKAATPAAPTLTPAQSASVDPGSTAITVSSSGATCTWGTVSGTYPNASGANYTVVVGTNTLYYSCVTGSGNTASDAKTGSWTFTGKNPVLYLQALTASTCPATRTLAVDARDNHSYWVRKVGSLCWMETNLAYAGGGTDTYGDVTPAITQGSASADYTYTEARYFIPTGANVTSGATNPSTSTDGGATNPQYGYLYNWCAAMNSQSAACQSGAATQPNQSVNGGTSSTLYNICPLNWRLPTGNAGEFTALNNAINSGSTTSPSGLFTNGLYMYSGYWNNGSFYNQGSNGYYWSSTVSGATSAYSLTFDSTAVNPASNLGKRYGGAIRCVSP